MTPIRTLPSSWSRRFPSLTFGFRPSDSDPEGERGFLLPFVVLIMLVGVLLVVPLLSFLSSGFRANRLTVDEEFAYYAADAAVVAVLSDLRNGEDALDPSYAVPTPTLNNYTTTVSIQEPPREDVAPFASVFVDPESRTGLSPLAAQTEFLYTLSQVQANTRIQINWAYTPTEGDWIIEVYEGVGTAGNQVVGTTGGDSPARVTADRALIGGGVYTVRFFNNSANPSTSAAFSPSGDTDLTWVRTSSFKDYVITATSGDITLVVVARQGPGPTGAQSSVAVLTWHGPN